MGGAILNESKLIFAEDNISDVDHNVLTETVMATSLEVWSTALI